MDIFLRVMGCTINVVIGGRCILGSSYSQENYKVLVSSKDL